MKRDSSDWRGHASPSIEAPVLHVPARVLEAVRARARAAWPRECCGLLVGGGETRRVARAVAVANVAEDEAGRYHIPATVLRQVEAAARGEGLDVVGVYHSHPDGTSTPSATDLESAWPWYSYLIQPWPGPGAVPAPAAARSWRLRQDRAGFDEEQVEIERGGPA